MVATRICGVASALASSRRAPLARAFFGLALVVAGCRGEREEGYFGTLSRHGRPASSFRVNNYDEPEHLDPALVSESAGSTLLLELFEPLINEDPRDLHPVQGVAERFEKSDDNRLFRFFLREDARWSDGKPVVAEDFAWAWRRVLRPETGARQVTLLFPLMNAALYHRAELALLGADATLEAAPVAVPRGDAAPRDTGARLAKGTPLRVYARTPATTPFAPLAEAPRTGPYTVALGSAKAQPSLEHASLGKVAAPDAAKAEPARILARGAPVVCNETDDFLFEVEVGGKRGHLPGCALGKAREATHALVAVHRTMPTFSSSPSPAPSPSPSPLALPAPPSAAAPRPRETAPGEALGFVPLALLESSEAALGVRAVGERVLEVELEHPTPYFLGLLGYPTFYPVRRDVVERFAGGAEPEGWTRPEHFVTNGPYRLKSHAFRYELRLEKNPHYWDAKNLRLDEIVVFEVTSSQATLALYKAGELDYLGSNGSLPTSEMDRLARFRDFDRSQWIGTYWYEFNIEKPPVNDARVRRALNLALDKRRLIDSVARAGQEPATQFVPDFTGFGYAEHVAELASKGADPFAAPAHGFDPATARALLAEAGYPVVRRDDAFVCEGFPPLEVLYNTSEGHRAIAVAAQALWKEQLGISVTLRNEEWKVMIKNLRDGHFQVARFGWVADYNHPHNFLDTFLSYSANNMTRWKDAAFDALVARAAAEPDPQKSIALYREAEARAVHAVPRLPIYFYTKSSLIKPYVKGYYPNAMNRHPIHWMWIDEAWRTDKENRPAHEPRELASPARFAP